MRIGIIGTRKTRNFNFFEEKLNLIINALIDEKEQITLVSGIGAGIDSLVNIYANKYDFELDLQIHKRNEDESDLMKRVIESSDIVVCVYAMNSKIAKSVREKYISKNLIIIELPEVDDEY